MVVPYNADLQNPASLDVLLGDRLMIEVPERPELQILGIGHHTQADPYWMTPGEFCLAETQEIFNLPDHIAAQDIGNADHQPAIAFHGIAGVDRQIHQHLFDLPGIGAHRRQPPFGGPRAR